jgi:hypothetical protein
MAELYYLPQFKQVNLVAPAGITAIQTTGIKLSNVDGIDKTKPGIVCIDWAIALDTSVAEWVTYTSIDDNDELVGVTRGQEGYSAKEHGSNAVIAWVYSKSHLNNLNDDYLVEHNTNGTHKSALVTTLKASKSTAAVGTSELEIMTPLSASIYGFDSMARQAIQNANFQVAQKVTSQALPSPAVTYTLDRWSDRIMPDSGTMPATCTRSQVALTPGELPGSFFLSRLTVNGAGSGFGVNAGHQMEQKIEHGTRFLAGDGKKVTVSFYARSSIANKKLGVNIIQQYGTGGSPTSNEVIAATVIPLTSTLTKYTVTLTLNTLALKTFGTANDDVLRLQFWYMWGTTVGTTQGLGAAETYVGSGTIDIAQVQVCSGDVALPFQPISYVRDLIECQRFCFVPETSNTSNAIGFGTGITTTRVDVFVKLPVTMRIVPQLTATAADWTVGDVVNAPIDVSAISLVAGCQSMDMARVKCDVAAGITVYRPYQLTVDGTAGRKIVFDAEFY